MARVPLRELAHARAGDKGDTSSISVWPYDPGDYPLLKDALTADVVKSAYPHLFRGVVVRHALDDLHGLNFVLHDALEGGVNTSLNLDGHGKSWSFLLLALEIDVPDNRASRITGADGGRGRSTDNAPRNT
ncbi:MAG: hypothetical protein AAGG99_06640 [Pseudomonadota bacterium]